MPSRAAESQSETEEPSQPFEPRDDDDETLFEVIEITGEAKNKYKVRWKGNDPKTKKPWSQSWVHKRDCTDDLVTAWKKLKKERRNSTKSGRNSVSSKRTSRSGASTTGIKSRSGSNITRRRSPSAGPSNLKSKSKGRFVEDVIKEEEEFQSADERKLLLGQRERPSVSVGRSHVMSPSPPSVVHPKGTKRKREAQSANPSTNLTTSRRIEAVPIDVDNDDRQTRRIVEVVVSNPPRKKRRILSDSENPPARKSLAHQGEKKSQVRNGSGRPQTPDDAEEGEAAGGAVVKEPHRADDEEEEEAIVEVALSDGGGMNDESRNNDFDVDPPNGKLQQTKGKEKGKAVLREEEEEESDEVEFLDMPDQRLPTQPKAAPTTHVRPSKGPGPMMMPQPPPPHWKTPPSNKHRNRPDTTAGASKVSKPLSKTRPTATTNKPKGSSLVAQSNPHSSKVPLFEPDLDRSPPEWHQKPQHPKPASKRPRTEVSEVISIQDSDDAESEISLSPGTRQRLAIFDVEVFGKKMRIAKKKRVNELNGRGEVSTSKRSGNSGNNRPTTSAVQPTQRFDTQSYSMDVVPETELENSQEDRHQISSIAVNSHEKRDEVSPVASTSITKSLQPIPQISPSAFHAHLQPPDSSLPDTIIEPSSSHERRSEIEAIEQFESPVKERLVFTKSTFLLNKNGVVPEPRKEDRLESATNQKESAEAVLEPGLLPRGQEIVEQAEAMRRRVSEGRAESSTETTKKKSVQEVVAHAEFRARSKSNASQPDEDDEEQQCEEEGVANASTSVVPPASGPPALSQDQTPVVDIPQAMEDDLNDVNVHVSEPEDVDKTHDDDDVTSAWINPEFLRQEEEESTQDIMAQRQRQEQEEGEAMKGINPNEGRDLGPPSVRAPSPGPAPINGDTGGLNALVSADEPKIPSRPPSLPPQKENQHDDTPRGPITRSRSRSKTPSVISNSRNNTRGKKKALKIPSPVPSRRESEEPELELPKAPIEIDVQKVQESSTQSAVFAGQLSSLQTQVHEKQAEIDSLQQTLNSLREELRSSEDRKALVEADRQKQMTELQSQWDNEKSAWEAERGLLTTQTATSEQSRIQADQDREFFREQYANASAYVTTVRKENKELEQRANIAEEQSKKGVELIKATFELQVAKLQDEAKTWRRMAEFTIQKDIQTNDHIRKRAAEEPELRMLCVRQKKSLKEARGKMDELQADLLEKTRLCDASTEEVEHCKKENARLHSDLNEALIKLDRLGRGDESTQGDDHEFVYRCMWRVETDNTQSGCPDVFSTMRELEQHLLTGHLAPH